MTFPDVDWRTLLDGTTVTDGGGVIFSADACPELLKVVTYKHDQGECLDEEICLRIRTALEETISLRPKA